MKTPWFKQWGWIHRPISWQGWMAVAVTVVLCVQVFGAVDRHSHSAIDTFCGIFPYVVPAVMLLNWLASRTLGQAGQR
jgi:hypothetical protein